MKKLILLLSFAAPLLSIAQSATIMPNSIGVPKVSTLPTCNTNAKGNQVMNTTDNKMYYCNGANWQEMTGGGFTLPYNGTVSSTEPALYLENMGSGRGIYVKTNGLAIRAESQNSYGIYSVSNSGAGIYAASSSGTGVYGYSESYFGGYFESYGNEPALYVYSYGGNAANFRGNVKIRDELVVDDGKGIVRSNSGTQQKVVRISGSLAYTNLAVGSYADSNPLNYEDFGGIPTVTVGQVVSATATGEYYKIHVIPINVSATQCQLRIVNLASDPVTFSATWQFLIVGPE
ncbi:hypothetical protein [Emticicia fontis]